MSRPAPYGLLLGLLLGLLTAAPATAQRFLPDDPLRVDPDRIDMPAPEPFEYNDYFGFLVNTLSDPVEYHGPALNVNTLGEVPNSSWYTNRHYVERLSLEALRRGPDTVDGPSRDDVWTVVDGKAEGVSVGLQVEDARGDRYLLKFDHPDYPEMSTGAEVVVTKLFYALGYHVPENFVVTFTRDQLVAAADATYEELGGDEKPLTPAYIDEMLARVPRNADGTYRALASRFLEGTPIGPFRYYGTRPDDGNDIYPHEGRRELRGLRVFAAWVNHTDARGQNSLDMIVEEDGRQYVRHHLIDFGSTLGGGPLGPKRYQAGFEHVLEPDRMVVRAVTLGFGATEWLDIDYPEYPSVGRIDVEHFDPDRWRNQYPNPAFGQSDAHDHFWAAKQVMHFTDEEIAAIVETGAYSNPEAEQYIEDILIGRRDRIGQAYLHLGGGLDRFAVRGGQLVFEDLPASYGWAPEDRARTIRWHVFDNQADAVGEALGTTTSADESLALPEADAPFLRAELVTPEVGSTRVYLRRTNAGRYEVVGVERTEAGE